jgi:hypothetical protein
VDVPEGMIRRPLGRIDRLRAEQTVAVNELVHAASQLVLVLERIVYSARLSIADVSGSGRQVVITDADLELAQAALDLAAELDHDWSKL